MDSAADDELKAQEKQGFGVNNSPVMIAIIKRN